MNILVVIEYGKEYRSMKKIIGIICLLCLAGLGIGAGFWYASEVYREEKIEL